jgi:hypothetical protein
MLKLLAIIVVAGSMTVSNAFAFDPTLLNMTLTDVQSDSYDNYDIITLDFSLFNNSTDSVTLSGHNMLYLNDTSDTQWEYVSHIDFPELSETDCPVLNSTIPSGQSGNIHQCFMVTNATDIGYNLVLNNYFYMMDWETQQFTLESVPSWFTTTANDYCTNIISESEYQTIIELELQDPEFYVLRTQSGTDAGDPLPDSIKNSACDWSNGQMSDYEFLDSIYWLIDNGKVQLNQN